MTGTGSTLLLPAQEFRAPPAPADTLADVIVGDDPDAFGTRATPTYGSRLVLRGKGPFRGWREQLVLDGAVLNRGRTNRPTTFHVETGQRVIFSVAADAGSGERIIQGEPFPLHTLAWWRTDAEVHTQWPADRPWWNLVFSRDAVEQAVRAFFGGRLLMPRESVRMVAIDPQQRAQFLSALEAAMRAPATVHKGMLADGLLTLVLAAMAPGGELGAQGAARTHSRSYARRLAVADGLVALADRVDEPVSLLAVCQVLDVSLRTLNVCSNAVLGMSAASYLRQRRLNRVYHDLSNGSSPSVTEAAVKHGFWELGRFAGIFQAAFGEPPSRTLRRTQGRLQGPSQFTKC